MSYFYTEGDSLKIKLGSTDPLDCLRNHWKRILPLASRKAEYPISIQNLEQWCSPRSQRPVRDNHRLLSTTGK